MYEKNVGGTNKNAFIDTADTYISVYSNSSIGTSTRISHLPPPSHPFWLESYHWYRNYDALLSHGHGKYTTTLVNK